MPRHQQQRNARTSVSRTKGLEDGLGLGVLFLGIRRRNTEGPSESACHDVRPLHAVITLKILFCPFRQAVAGAMPGTHHACCACRCVCVCVHV